MNYQASRAGRRAIALVWLIASVVVAVGAGRATAGEAGSNLDLMTNLTRGAVAEVVATLDGARAGRGVRLVAAAASEEYRFIENVFTAVLTERGVQVFKERGEGEAPQNAVALHYEATEFGVTYPDVFRTYLIGGKKVRREALVTIVATLVDPASGAVLDVAEASRETSDVFSHGNLDRVEQGTFEFVRPAVPSSGWTRIVEPVFVSGIIIGLIYLFFSNQSDE
jgi:hypothetical protein